MKSCRKIQNDGSQEFRNNDESGKNGLPILLLLAQFCTFPYVNVLSEDSGTLQFIIEVVKCVFLATELKIVL